MPNSYLSLPNPHLSLPNLITRPQLKKPHIPNTSYSTKLHNQNLHQFTKRHIVNPLFTKYHVPNQIWVYQASYTKSYLSSPNLIYQTLTQFTKPLNQTLTQLIKPHIPNTCQFTKLYLPNPTLVYKTSYARPCLA